MIRTKCFLILILLNLLIANTLFAAPGEVQNLRPKSAHVLNTPSQVSLIEMEWDLPEGYTSVEGYYYKFTNESSFTMDETTTATLTLIDTAYAASDYSGSNDEFVYVYVAAVAYNTEIYEEELGTTTKFGPIRVDTETPANAGVSVSSYINTATANLSIGGFGNAGDASQMYISNVNYGVSGEWEVIAASKPWPIEGSQGRKTIYIRFQDDAGNQSDKSVFTLYDSTAPTASVTSPVSTVTKSDAIPFTIIFNDPTQVGVDEISGFDTLSLESSDISITNALIENLTAVSGASSTTVMYNFNAKPVNQGLVSILILSDTINDQASNGNTASEKFSFTYDTVSPNVVIASSTSNKTNVSPLPVTITFSEAVAGFEESDLSVTNGNIQNFTSTGDNLKYTFEIIPAGQGEITVGISEGSASDSAGNTNTASQSFSRTYDSVQPTVALASTIQKGETTEISPIPFTVTFSESVENFQSDDIALQNATVGNFSGTSSVFQFNAFPVMPSGLTQVEISVNINANSATDLAGNNNTASEVFSLTYTTERPTVSMNAEKSKSITPQAIDLTFVFSRPVVGFNVADITVLNGSILLVSEIDGSDGYTATYLYKLTPDGQKDVHVSIAENAAQTASGYTNTASATFIYDINNAPEISIDQTVYQTYEDTVSPSIRITALDADGDTLSISVVAAHIIKYTINTQTGNTNPLTITVLPEANYTSPITLTILVKDPYQLTNSLSCSLQITPVNDPPDIIFNNTPLIYTENDPAKAIDPESIISDIDSSNFNNGYMKIGFVQNVTENDRIFLVESEPISITDETISYESTAVGSYTFANNNQSITITFNNACGAITATSILQKVYYENVSDNPSELNRKIYVLASDGESAYSSVQTIQVTAVNDIPQELSLDGMDSISIPDGLTPGASVATLLAQDIETASGALTYSLISGEGDTHNSLFTIEGNQLKTINMVSYESNSFFNVRLQVLDADGGKAEKSFVIFVLAGSANVVGVPTLDEWAKIIFFAFILLAALFQIKKTSTSFKTVFYNNI
ncbi:conserved hypothetical protein, secreted [Candidatus Magnetomorum sp. HK-1]|nr:conserved hypothetical protein, secreted [Candidatus Magnetomorum sp. HK-1]